MWFELKGDKRFGKCTSEGCYGQPTWRLEASGVGSDYCSGCKAIIERGERPQRQVPGATLAELLYR